MTHLFGAAGLSWNLVDDARAILSQHFMVNAYRAGTIVALTAGAIGWFMVLRRQSFAGHALAVVSFPGAAGAVLIGVSATAGYFTAAVAAALVISAATRRRVTGSYGGETAVIGTVQAFALAYGALFVGLYGGFLNTTTGLLFGTFLGINDAQVLTLALAALGALTVLVLIARPLLFATVDPDVALAKAVPVRALSVVFLVLLGCAAAEVSQVTGVLLVFALLVMPAASAQQITARPGLSLALTFGIGLAVVWAGLGAAYFSVYPVGFFVTTIGFGIYLVSRCGRAVADRRANRATPRTGELA